MFEMSVAHTLVAHLQRIVIVGRYAVVLTPRPDAVEQRASAARHFIHLVPELYLEGVLDDFIQGTAG